MAKCLVTYDLKKNKDYVTLIQELHRLGACKALLSVWVLDSQNSVTVLRDHLRKYIDSDDKLLVVGLNGSWGSVGLTTGEVACLNRHVG